MSDKNQAQPRYLAVVHRIEDGLLISAIAVVIFCSTLQIILRNFFDSGVVWISPLLSILLLWVGLLGALVATRQHAHIRIDILSTYLPQRLQNLSQFVVHVFSAGVLFVLAYYSLEFVKLDYESAAMAFADVPVWVTELILPFSFSLIGFRFAVLAVASGIRLFPGRLG